MSMDKTPFSGQQAFSHLVAQVDLGLRAPGMPGHEAVLDLYEAELGKLDLGGHGRPCQVEGHAGNVREAARQALNGWIRRVDDLPVAVHDLDTRAALGQAGGRDERWRLGARRGRMPDGRRGEQHGLTAELAGRLAKDPLRVAFDPVEGTGHQDEDQRNLARNDAPGDSVKCRALARSRSARLHELSPS